MAQSDNDAIAMRILGLYADGEALNYGSMENRHPSLLRAAIRRHGSWRAAIEAAGLEYDQIRKYNAWTKERIVARIQELHRQGEDLSWRHVSTQLDPQLAAAATKASAFTTWRAAIEAAGLEYDQIRRYRHWDEEEVLRSLRALAAEGRALNSRDVQLESVDLFAAALRIFGGWDEALRAAGFNAEEVRLRRPYERHPRR